MASLGYVRAILWLWKAIQRLEPDLVSKSIDHCGITSTFNLHGALKQALSGVEVREYLEDNLEDSDELSDSDFSSGTGDKSDNETEDVDDEEENLAEEAAGEEDEKYINGDSDDGDFEDEEANNESNEEAGEKADDKADEETDGEIDGEADDLDDDEDDDGIRYFLTSQVSASTSAFNRDTEARQGIRLRPRLPSADNEASNRNLMSWDGAKPRNCLKKKDKNILTCELVLFLSKRSFPNKRIRNNRKKSIGF
jgi:hypothetical protein